MVGHRDRAVLMCKDSGMAMKMAWSELGQANRDVGMIIVVWRWLARERMVCWRSR